MADPTNGSNGDLPEPTEDYQQKLHRFLAEVPALQGDKGPNIVSGTPFMKTPFTKADIDALGKTITTNPLFRKYTGWEHKALLQKWLKDRTTTCNEFVTQCAVAMGFTAK